MDYVNIKEAAQILGCSMASVKKAVDSGAIPALKLSDRVYRIPKSALQLESIAEQSKRDVGSEG